MVDMTPRDMDGPRPWSSGSDEGYVPSPPPRPPSSQRPRPQSSRRRPGSARSSQPIEPDLPNVSVMRPPSSLNKFRPLPSISSPSLEDDTQEVISKVNDLHLDSKYFEGQKSQKSEVKTEPVIKTKSITPSPVSPTKYYTGPHVLPKEPNEHEDRLHLAVKLPTNGKRCHRYFSSEDYLQDLLHFAENVAEEDLSDYVLACNAPRKVFSVLTQRICDVGIPDKTVLYFEERADT